MCDTKGRLDGKVAIVTGGSSGIGLEVAKNLAEKGARVIIASRNETKLVSGRDQIVKATGNTDIAYGKLDLGSLKSVRAFANEVLLNEGHLDILVNNAGAVGLPDRLTEDGLNLTMQVNFFGTFLLTYLLLPMLKASAPSRIINSLAGAMYIGHIDFDHWNDVERFSAIEALGNSKLATSLFTAELTSKLSNTDVTVNSFDPFIVSGTGIFENFPDYIKPITNILINIIGQKKEDIGKQVAYLAAEPSLSGVSGRNYKFCYSWINHWLNYDKVLTERLWDEAKKVVQITYDDELKLTTTYRAKY